VPPDIRCQIQRQNAPNLICSWGGVQLSFIPPIAVFKGLLWGGEEREEEIGGMGRNRITIQGEQCD